MEEIEKLREMCDDGTTHVEVATPPGWKCPRPNCRVDFYHGHSSYEDKGIWKIK